MRQLLVINLDRRPDRKKHIQDQFKNQNISLEFYSAKDARDYTLSSYDLTLFISYPFLWERYSKAVICNFLSHRDLWENIVLTNKLFTIISQDDIKISKNFSEVVEKVINNFPKDAEIVWLGLPEILNENESYKEGEYVNDVIKRIKTPKVNPMSTTYIITLQGAKNIIKESEGGVDCNGDIFMNRYLLSKNIFYVSDPVVVSVDDSLGSDIFTDLKWMATKDMVK